MNVQVSSSYIVGHFLFDGRVRDAGTGSTVTLKLEHIISDQQGNARISFEQLSLP